MRDEDELLRDVALKNATSILHARQRAETQLLLAQERLRESEQRLQAALTAAGTGTFRWDFSDNSVDADANLNAIFGFPDSSQLRSQPTFLDAVHPDDRPEVERRAQDCMTNSVDFDMEFRVLLRDGSLRWVDTKGTTFCDEHGRPTYMIGACVNITARIQSEEALRESAERLRVTFYQAAVGIATANLVGRLVEVNKKFADVLGYSAEELQRISFIDITHPDDVAVTRENTRRLLAREISHCVYEKRFIRKDGNAVWSRTTVTLITNALGEPQHFIGVVEDISERKAAELALIDETRMLELLNETGSALASSLDTRSLVQAVTDAATKLSGAAFGAFFYNTSSAEGDAFMLYTLSGAPRSAFEKFGQPRATELFGPTFRGESPIRIDDVLQDHRYGSAAPFHGMPPGHPPVRSFLTVPVISRSGEVIGGLFFGHPDVGIFTERTERLIVGVAAQAAVAVDNARLYDSAQRAAQEREQLLESERAARAEAEHMSSMKDDFLATLSHELRTPLSAILGWSQVLRHSPQNYEDMTRGLDTIERNARIQQQLIEDMLDVSRITSGKLRLDIQPVSPAAFVEAALDTIRPAADAKGIRIAQLLDPAAGPISGDPNRLQQVAWNVLSNAIKFTPRGGKVQVLLERINSHVEISIADTGAGISPEFLPHVFERFRQADASTTRRHGGLGLGLSIVRHLMELHGGSVRISSPGNGLGTTVTLHFPLKAVHSTDLLRTRLHPSTPVPTASNLNTINLQGIRVLVVDDHADTRELVMRVLSDCGAQVYSAGSAVEALRLLQNLKPHVLISDIGMPDVDGLELIRRVRALGAYQGGAIPAIALSAFARSEDRTRALRAGFLVHVAKPVEATELIATVASVVGRAPLTG